MIRCAFIAALFALAPGAAFACVLPPESAAGEPFVPPVGRLTGTQ
jgi:hypothetical protein